MPLTVNRRFDRLEFEAQLTKLQRDLTAKFSSNQQLVAASERLIQFGRQLVNHVDDYDFKDVQANGYRTCLQMGLKMFETGLTSTTISESDFESMVKLFDDATNHVNDLLIDSRRDLERDGRPLSESSSVDIVAKFISRFLSSSNDSNFRALFGPMSGFDGSSTFNHGYFNYLLPTSHSSWSHYLTSFVDVKMKTRLLIDMFRNLDIDLIKKHFGGSQNWIYTTLISTMVNGATFMEPLETRRTFMVRQPRQWRLNCDVIAKTISVDQVDDEIAIKESQPVNCRLLRFGDTIDGNVIFFAHGGGFVSNCAEGHEVFLRQWSRRLPGVTFVNVDYSLAPEAKFPIAIQQLLDCYLWLISGHPSVNDAIGLTNPLRIAFAGDSSGALLLMSTLMIINDLNHDHNLQIRLPDGFLGCYSSFTVAPRMVASNLMSAFNFMLFPTVIVNVVDAFYPDLKSSIDNQGEGSKPIVQLVTDEEQLAKYFRDNRELLEHPYMSPSFYGKFDELSSVKLRVVALHSDPVLDYSVMLARKWSSEGDVQLDVLDELSHGFLNFIFLGVFNDKLHRLHSDATDLCCRRLREILKIDCYN